MPGAPQSRESPPARTPARSRLHFRRCFRACQTPRRRACPHPAPARDTRSPRPRHPGAPPPIECPPYTGHPQSAAAWHPASQPALPTQEANCTPTVISSVSSKEIRSVRQAEEFTLLPKSGEIDRVILMWTARKISPFASVYAVRSVSPEVLRMLIERLARARFAFLLTLSLVMSSDFVAVAQ